MKKHVLGILLGCISVSSLSAQDKYIGSERLKALIGSYLYNTVVFYKGNSWFLPLKYFTFYAAPPAVLSAIATMNKSGDTQKATASVIGLVSGLTGLLIEYGNRFNRVQMMDHYLKEYTKYESFGELTDPEAAMLCAAHRKNIQVMRNLLPYLTHFLQQRGIWKVLTELYFDEPEKIVSTESTSYRPGYSQHNGFSIDYVTQNSISKVKRAYMSKKTMKRRMKVLKEKLGYTE